MVRQANDCAKTEDLVDGIFNNAACLLIEDGKDFVKDFALGLMFLPAGELLGNRVHKADGTVGATGNNCVTNAAERGVQPLFTRIRLFAALFDLPDLLFEG